MSQRLPRPAAAAAALAWATLGLLGLVVLAVTVLLVASGDGLAERYPEFAGLRGPLSAVVVMLGLCLEAGLAITALLVGEVDAGRIRGALAMRSFGALLMVLILATADLIAALTLVPGPPILWFAVFGAVVAGLAAVLVGLVVRFALLRTATDSADRSADRR